MSSPARAPEINVYLVDICLSCIIYSNFFTILWPTGRVPKGAVMLPRQKFRCQKGSSKSVSLIFGKFETMHTLEACSLYKSLSPQQLLLVSFHVLFNNFYFPFSSTKDTKMRMSWCHQLCHFENKLSFEHLWEIHTLWMFQYIVYL